jgi:pyruvate-formate lyase-activating enzyme
VQGCCNHFGCIESIVSSDVVVDFLAHSQSRGFSKVTLCGGDPLARPGIISLLQSIETLGIHINLDTAGTPLLGPAATRFFGRVHVDRIWAADFVRSFVAVR